jgi:hypothetical protein
MLAARALAWQITSCRGILADVWTPQPALPGDLLPHRPPTNATRMTDATLAKPPGITEGNNKWTLVTASVSSDRSAKDRTDLIQTLADKRFS